MAHKTRGTAEVSKDVTGIMLATFVDEFDNGNSGAGLAIDWNNGRFQAITLTANATLTFTAPTNGKPTTLSLRVIQNGTGGWTLTLPSGIKWPGGTDPVITAAAGAIDIISFEYRGAAGYYGVASQNFS